mgnify:CR=1 FL=1
MNDRVKVRKTKKEKAAEDRAAARAEYERELDTAIDQARQIAEAENVTTYVIQTSTGLHVVSMKTINTRYALTSLRVMHQEAR